MKKCLSISLLFVDLLCGQSPTLPQPLKVTRIYGITSPAQTIDNRSASTRTNNYHSFACTGTGNWSAALEYSDTSAQGPWLPTSNSGTVTQANFSNIGYANGYHPFFRINITGTTTCTYTAAKDFFLSTSVASLVFPLGIAQGGTGQTAFTLNSVLLGNGGSPIAEATGTANQVLRIPGHGGAPAFGSLDLASIGTGTLPVSNGGTGAATLTGPLIGNGTSPITGLSTSSQLQFFRRKANVTGTQYEFADQPHLNIRDYAYTQTPGGTLAQGANVPITMTPCPLGINAADANEYVWISGGSGALTATVSNASNATPITITTTVPHGFATGNLIALSGILGNSNANGMFVITVTAGSTFILINSSGNGTYTSGGTATRGDEAALITGGTCTSGAASGTLLLSVQNPHSGNWAVSSSTDGTQEAINVAAPSRGIVIVPPKIGGYQIRAGVHLKRYVNLQCAENPNYTDNYLSMLDGYTDGCVFIVTANQGDSGGLSTDANPRQAFLVSSGSNFRGFTFYYPNQFDTTNPERYPPTIRLQNGVSIACTLNNLYTVNSWVFVDATAAHGSLLIDGLYGSPLYRGVVADFAVDNDAFRNFHMFPWWNWQAHGIAAGPPAFIAYPFPGSAQQFIINNAAVIYLYRSDGLTLYNITAGGYHDGIVMDGSSTSGKGSYGHSFGYACDSCVYGLRIINNGMTSHGWLFTSNTFVPDNPFGTPGIYAAFGIYMTGQTGTGTLKLAHSVFNSFPSRTHSIIWADSGEVELSHSTQFSWSVDPGHPAVVLGGTAEFVVTGGEWVAGGSAGVPHVTYASGYIGSGAKFVNTRFVTPYGETMAGGVTAQTTFVNCRDSVGPLNRLPFVNNFITATVGSANTIAASGALFHITGTTTIKTMHLPPGFSSGSVCAIPDGLWKTDTTGNFAIASTAVLGTMLCWAYDPGTMKWYPSY